jgi:hypothetical protein
MTTLIARAIDTSILMFKTTAVEQSSAQSNPETTGSPANLGQATPPNSEGRVPERQENSANQDLRIPNHTSLPTVYDSLKLLTDLRPASFKPTVGSNSTTSASNLLHVSAHEAVPAVHQDDGNDLSLMGDHLFPGPSISTSSKGKQKAIYSPSDADDYQDCDAYQELQFGHLKRPVASQDDQFGQSNVQLEMNTDPNFEDFYLDSGLEPDWNWFTEVSQRLV